MHIKRFVNLLSDHMKEKFPEIEIGFYVSKRTNYEHTGKETFANYRSTTKLHV